MNNIVLTSCGIRKENFKNEFYKLIPKEELIKNSKREDLILLYDGDGIII